MPVFLLPPLALCLWGLIVVNGKNAQRTRAFPRSRVSIAPAEMPAGVPEEKFALKRNAATNGKSSLVEREGKCNDSSAEWRAISLIRTLTLLLWVKIFDITFLLI